MITTISFLLGVYVSGLIFVLYSARTENPLTMDDVGGAVLWPFGMMWLLVVKLRQERSAKRECLPRLADERMGVCFTCMDAADCEQRDRRIDCEDYQLRPVIVLSGSTRFRVAFREWAARLVVEEDAIVLPPTVWSANEAVRSDEALCARLLSVHLSKIDLADELFVLDVGKYIGDSTRFEIQYAKQQGCRIRYLSEEHPGWTESDAGLTEMWMDGTGGVNV